MRERGLDVPFIILSGGIGEEAAVEAMRGGAYDYVLKDRPARLGQAARRALEDKRQRDERRAAEAARRESEGKYRLLLEHSGLGVGYYTLDGVLVFFNQQAGQHMGGSSGDFIGKSMREMYGPAADEYLRRLHLTAGSAASLEFEDFIALPTGERWFLSTYTRVLDAAGQVSGVQIISADITGRKQAEQAVQRRERELRLLFAASQRFGATLDLEAIYAVIHDTVASLAPCDGLFISRYDPETRLIHCAAGWMNGRPVEAADYPPVPLAPEGRGVQSLVLRGGEPMIFNDYARQKDTGRTQHYVADDGKIRPAVEPDERTPQSSLAVPIKVEGQVTGVIQVFSYAPDAYTGDHLRLVEALAPHAGAAIANARLYQQAQADIQRRMQHEREMEALSTVSAALRTADTRADMLPALLDQAMLLLGAGGAALEMLTPSDGGLQAELGRGVWAPVTGTRIPPGDGLSAQVLATGQPYLNNDARADPRLFRPDLLGDCAAVAGAPLWAEGRIIGLLWAASRRPLTDYDLRLLVAVADMAGSAIQRAALHEQTGQRLRKLTALRAIDQVITGSFELRLMLSVVAEQTAAQLNADAADVLLYNPRTHMLEFAAGHGFRTRIVEQSRVRLGDGVAGEAALNRRTRSVPELSAASTGFARALQMSGEGFVSHHATPLIAKGRVKGVLEVFHRARLVLDAEWVEFLETLAVQAAIAIDNATLFADLQRSNTDLALAYDATIEGWGGALELRDKDTRGHTLRVTELTLDLAQAMGALDEQIVHARRGALLHDIGKMGVPDAILHKAGPLTGEEWEVMRQHPQLAYDMLSPILYLRPALDIPYCHHEKWDGTGYPRGLAGENIPLAARIFAVADVWDALINDRPYRPAWPADRALEYIAAQSGRHFDPQVVTMFLNAHGRRRL